MARPPVRWRRAAGFECKHTRA